ncbi:unnamed protein product, partial [Ectocarpus sp. 13 AM-2016]
GGGISTIFLNRYVLARDKEMDFANTFREQKKGSAVCGRRLSLCALGAIVLAGTAQY